MDTMRIWSEVWQTDPSYTKRVNQRGGFTAIDAYYKILKATRQFGPAGQGWGWEELRPPEIVDGVFLVAIRLWWREAGDPEEHGYPVYGSAMWERNGKVDEDAPKKALTDAITKGLSYIGLCADVFLGKFDDSKYVEQQRQRIQREAQRQRRPEPTPEAEGDRDPAPRNGTSHNGAGHNGATKNGASRNGASPNGAGHHEEARPPVERAAPERNGASRNGSARNGAPRNGTSRPGSGRHGRAPEPMREERPAPDRPAPDRPSSDRLRRHPEPLEDDLEPAHDDLRGDLRETLRSGETPLDVVRPAEPFDDEEAPRAEAHRDQPEPDRLSESRLAAAIFGRNRYQR